MSKKEKKVADAMRIFEALSGVDEELLIRCEESTGEGASGKKVRPIWYYGKVLAACFCFVVCGAVMLNMGSLLLKKETASSDRANNSGRGMEQGTDEMAVVAEEGLPEESVLEEIVLEENVKEENRIENAIEESAIEESARAEGAIEESAKKESALGESNIANGKEECVEQNAMAAVGNTNFNAEKEQNSGSSKVDGGTMDQYGEQEKLMDGQTEADRIPQIQDTTDSLNGCIVDYRENITLKEAKEVEGLGEYVPDKIPEGYVLESAKKTCDVGTGEVLAIGLCWTRGMDSIMLNIAKVDRNEITVVDIKQTEAYNVHFYQIPYADTVPDKYRAVFDHPVFAEGDFALDVVKARMKVVEDAGDTDTPRGNFAVMYEEGVLVEFSGRGDVESIYQMFR